MKRRSILTAAFSAVVAAATIHAAEPSPPPPLPEPISSFGAAVAGGYLYVYSGHTGVAHTHSAENLSKAFRRLKINGGAAWEELAKGRPLQGVALVAHGESVIRVGGMEARNQPGKPEDMHSVDEVAKFDPATGKWTSLPPLPKPRSSHDAAVIGDTLYVVGGWQLAGDARKGTWEVGTWSLDLANPKAKWEALPDPIFRRRALAVGAANGKLYVVGGLNSDRDVVPTTSVYDPVKKEWSNGPDLPGKDKQAFGAQAATVGGLLYVNGMDGKIHRLNASGERWSTVAKLKTPTFLHRLAPWGDGRIVAIAGASDKGETARLELIDVAGPSKIASR